MGLMGAKDVVKSRKRPRVANVVRKNSKVWSGISGRGQTGLEQKAAAGLEMQLPWKNLGLVRPGVFTGSNSDEGDHH